MDISDEMKITVGCKSDITHKSLVNNKNNVKKAPSHDSLT